MGCKPCGYGKSGGYTNDRGIFVAVETQWHHKRPDGTVNVFTDKLSADTARSMIGGRVVPVDVETAPAAKDDKPTNAVATWA